MNKFILAAGMAAAATSTTESYAADERFHPIEKVCIEYVMKGQIMNGTTYRCHRKFGLETFEVQNMEMGIGGIKQTQNSHNITIKDTIYAIDTVKQTGTISTNPMYEHFKNAVARGDQSAEAIGRTFLSTMGYAPDGTSKTIDGVNCNGYRSQMVGYACLTEELLMLEQEFLGNRQTAVRVAIGDDGGDDNYTLWQRVNMRQGLDLSSGINVQDLTNGNANVQDILKQLQQVK